MEIHFMHGNIKVKSHSVYVYNRIQHVDRDCYKYLVRYINTNRIA